MEQEMRQMFELVLEKLGHLNDKMDGVETRLAGVETRLDAVETRLDAVETRLDAVETEIVSLKERVQSIEVRQDEIYQIVRSIEHSNETRKAEIDSTNVRVAYIEGTLQKAGKVLTTTTA